MAAFSISSSPCDTGKKREDPVLQVLFYTRVSLTSTRWDPHDLNTSHWVLLPSSAELRITFAAHEFGWRTCIKHSI